MSKVILTLAIIALFSLASATRGDSVSALWGTWKAAHGKRYLPSEEVHRFNVFQQNLVKIAKHNAENTDVKLGVNQFADLTSTEFKSRFVNGLIRPTGSNRQSIPRPIIGDLPESVDWREKGAVTGVKNQGQCGSCWAFSAIGALEGLYFIKNNKLESFSEQNMVDCVQDGCEGCNGGWMNTTFEYVAKNGVETEADYPYKARDQKCAQDKSKSVRINTDTWNVPENNATQLKATLATQPVSVAIQADQLVFQFYKIGVIKTGCGAALNHGVLAVGYEKVNGNEAFIVKNSWGATWGNKGYVYISTDESANKGAGVCGILNAASVPL